MIIDSPVLKKEKAQLCFLNFSKFIILFFNREAGRHCSLRTESDYVNSGKADTFTCPSNLFGGNREPICAAGDLRALLDYKYTYGSTTGL